jgi:hypothetical protein
MSSFAPIPTENEQYGFWGTSVSNGYDAALTWDTASRFLSEHFDLTPEQACKVLDSRFGRHLADQLSYIKSKPGIASGPSSAAAIIEHLKTLVTDLGWRDCFENAIRAETDKIYPRRKPLSKDELFTLIAQQHLGFDTLVERKSGEDFKETSVWCVKEALKAAYEAGRAAKSKK